jgi:hypothetical protein
MSLSKPRPTKYGPNENAIEGNQNSHGKIYRGSPKMTQNLQI